MSIQLAIETLNQYKVSRKTKALESNYPLEMRRRNRYIDNLIHQLTQAYRYRGQNYRSLIADDIRHCLLHKYYPELKLENPEDGFSLEHTLVDVAQLLEQAIESNEVEVPEVLLGAALSRPYTGIKPNHNQMRDSTTWLCW